MLRPLFHTVLPFCFALVLLPAAVSARVIEQLIAVIDGEPYTLTNLGTFAKTRLGREFPTGDLNQINARDREVLEQFITEKLLESEIREAGVKITDQEVNNYIEQVKARSRLSDDDLRTALSREGQTLAGYRILVKSELEKNEIINREVRRKVNITNEDVERYYKLNAKNYRSDERARLRHIMLPVTASAPAEAVEAAMEKGKSLHSRIVAGEDFASLAKEFSEGAGRADGGDIGWVKRGTLISGLEEVAFKKLSLGQVSEPFRTSMGVHILKLEAREAERMMPLNSVAQKIKDDLQARALEERFAKWLRTDLRRKHHVDIKIPGVVFKAEDSKEGTVDSLMAKSARWSKKEERSFLSYLNPLSYVTNEIDTEEEDPKSPLYGKKIVTVFGFPLFTSDSVDDVPDVLSERPEKPAASQSGGFLSSILDSLNPFSSKKP